LSLFSNINNHYALSHRCARQETYHRFNVFILQKSIVFSFNIFTHDFVLPLYYLNIVLPNKQTKTQLHSSTSVHYRYNNTTYAWYPFPITTC